MKKIIVIIACSLGILLWEVFISVSSKQIPEPDAVLEHSIESVAPEISVQSEVSAISSATTITDTVATLVVASAENAVTPVVLRADATLVVLGKEYPITLDGEKTLEEVMKTLRETTDFSYSGKDFSGMGFFVESINGQKSEGRMHWIVYVNDKLASSGVSQLLVRVGDRVEWRYEAEK